MRGHHGHEGHLRDRVHGLGDAQDLRALEDEGLHGPRAAGVEDRGDAVPADALVEAALRVRVAVGALQHVVDALADLEVRVADPEVELAAHRLGERLEGEHVLVRPLRGGEEGGGGAGLLQGRGHPVERRRDAHALPRGGAADAGAGDAVGHGDLLVEGAARVAHPGLVDVGVAAGPQALHLAVPLVHGHVAAGRAAGADRLVLLQEPDPHLEAEVVAEERPHRADVGEVARVVVGRSAGSRRSRSGCGRRGSRTRARFVPVTSRSKRRQREHSTQRSASSMIGPRSTTLRLRTLSSSSTFEP